MALHLVSGSLDSGSMNIILDAKITICAWSQAAWINLAIADPEFGQYAWSEVGARQFIALFTAVTHNNNVRCTYLFGLKHSIYGAPASQTDDGFCINTRAWWWRGVYHRVDGPAYISDVGPHESCGPCYEWYNYGNLHRDGGPAVVTQCKSQWWCHGVQHRTDGPAVIGNSTEWWQYGELHRGGGRPAVVSDYGDEWWCRGERHRDGDLPAVNCDDQREWWYYGKLHRGGDKPALKGDYEWREWWVNNKRHRGGGRPALIFADGFLSEWWFNGVRHNIDGPAVIRPNGAKKWYLFGDRRREWDGLDDRPTVGVPTVGARID